MKALFVCNDKEEWNLMHKIFKSHFKNIDLVCAIKGEDSLELLTYEGPFGIVLIDAGLKNETPTELAENILDQSGERPVIFIGEENVIQSRINDDFYLNNELADIFTKPYDIDRFKETINKALSWAKKEEFEQSIEEFDRFDLLPMKLRNFYLFKQVPFDAYIELTKTKFIKAITKNKPYTEATIVEFAKRNIKFLYLKKDEHLKFLEDSIAKIEQNLQKNLPGKKTIQTQIAAALIIHQYLKDVGISESVISLTNHLVESTCKTFEQYGNLKNLISEFPFEHGDSSERSILMFYLCEALSRGMGWGSDISRKKLGLACIIHDALLINEEMIRVPTLDNPDLDIFSDEEIENYKNHAKEAAELAQYFSGFTDTEFIIEQHHELPDGSGFPRKLNSSRLTSISCVFILAHNFTTYISIHGLNKNTISRCYSEMKNYYNVGDFKDPLAVLKRILK